MSAVRDEVWESIVVGSGFAGLGAALQLKRAGRERFVVLEKAEDLGGTWRENTYPGCACDVPSLLYSFSFEPSPTWTRQYAARDEIHAYLKGCAERNGLGPHLRFGEQVSSARFDEREALWTVKTKRGSTYRARYLLLGTGALHLPSYPKLDGLETFAGKTFHSAAWDDSVALEGKRVAVIGTGASAIQFVPQIVDRVKTLSVFQRTAPWVLPKPDRAFSGVERRFFRSVPGFQRLYRSLIYWRHELRASAFILNPRLMKVVEWVARRHIERQIPDPKLRAKVTPDYTPGCKRLLISNDYYPALARPNASLVIEPIERVTPEGIVTEDGVLHEADVLIYGTGFRVAEQLVEMNIVGLGERTIAQAWEENGINAYKGTTVAGFPNLFILTGPNTGLGHNSMVFMIEAQLQQVLKQMDAVDARRAAFVDVLPDAQKAWNQAMKPRLQRAVWASGCRSWYVDEKGNNPTLWPGFTFEFWAKMRGLDESHLRFEQRT